MAKKETKRSSMRDAARKRAEERQQSGSGGTKYIFPEDQKIEFFKPEKGKMLIDIIPYQVTVDNHPAVKKGELWYQRTIWVHFGIGAEEKSYLCLKTIGKRCPICDDRAKMMKSPDGDEDIIKALAPKEREMFNIIDTKDTKAGVQLWEYSYHLFGKLLETELREDEDGDYANFAELEGGKTLELRFKEKKMGKNAFLEVDRIDFKDRDEDYDEDILEDVLDLDAILNVLPYDKLSAVYFEQEEEDAPVKSNKKSSKKDDEEEEEEKPAKKKSSKKPAKDEEEDVPKRKSKSKPAKDEEEEEAPVKKSKKKPEPEPEDDEPTYESVSEMSYKELVTLVEDKEIDDVDVDDYTAKKVEKLREAIIEALGLEEEEEAPVKKSTSKKSSKKQEEEEAPAKKAKKKSSDDEEPECPVEGGTFGEDCDDYDECFECDFWQECKDATEEKKKSTKKKK